MLVHFLLSSGGRKMPLALLAALRAAQPLSLNPLKQGDPEVSGGLYMYIHMSIAVKGA